MARLSETIVAFACLFPCGIETAIAFADAGRASIETVIAFAGAGRASTETVIAFAGEKWAVLVHFSGAVVMPVSAVPCWGASSGVVRFNVATLSRLVREIVRPARSKHRKIGVFWHAGRVYLRKCC